MSDQLANPFRKQEPGLRRVPPPPPIGPKEWARLYVMALVFLVALGLSIYFGRLAKKEPAKKAAPADQIDYSIRKDRESGQAQPTPGPAPAPGPQEPEKKKDIALPPLPQGEIASFKELAAPFRDGMDPPVKETPEFLALLQVMLKNVTAASLVAKALPEVTAAKAYLEPAKYRGEVVGSYGRLIKIYTETLNATTPDDIKYVYVGFMEEYRTNRTVCFYLPELPKDAAGKPVVFRRYVKGGQEFYEDWVTVHGVFLRTYDYASQYEDEKMGTVKGKAAVLFARTVMVDRKPGWSNARSGFIVVVAGLAVLVVTIVLVAGVMSRKYGSGSMRMKMHHLKKDKGQELPRPDPEKQLLGAEVQKPAAAAEKDAPPPPAAP